jgi:EmrB/QacA subfamily drug resistance transporter
VLGGVAPQLDTTVVNVGLRAIGRGVGSPAATIQWVATAYLLALGVTIPLSGWASTRWGGRRVWLAALALFLAGSVLAGIAPDAGMLIGSRVLQGAAAGVLAPLLLTLLLQGAGDRPLGRLMTLVTLVAVVVPIVGPVVGGVIVQELSWRWLFFVNVPVTIAALVAAWLGVRDAEVPRAQPLDVLGLGLLSPALAAILYGLSAASGSMSGTAGFGQAAVIVPVAAGLGLGAGFVAHALRRRSAAIIDLRIFRQREFAGGATLLALSGLSLYGAMLLLPLYEQTVRGHDALTAGLLLAPQGVGALLVRPVGPVVDRIGARPVVLAGTLLALAGTLPYALAGPTTSELLLGGALVVRGAGLSATNIAVLSAALQGLEQQARAHASAATRIVQYVGGAFGTAVLATILTVQLATHPAGLAGVGQAFDVMFRWSLAFTAVGLAPAFLLPARLGLRGDRPISP